ncbi:hypothetical protein Bbelb_031770 [Branchiostoma belcheri]|nr:hypothetical protein Bbelb_031770 [Branchiostoma belcheri]
MKGPRKYYLYGALPATQMKGPRKYHLYGSLPGPQMKGPRQYHLCGALPAPQMKGPRKYHLYGSLPGLQMKGPRKYHLYEGCQHSLKLFRCEPHVPSINVSCLVGSRGSQPANFRVGQWDWENYSLRNFTESPKIRHVESQRRYSAVTYRVAEDDPASLEVYAQRLENLSYAESPGFSLTLSLETKPGFCALGLDMFVGFAELSRLLLLAGSTALDGRYGAGQLPSQAH